jgi:hypothetical protein
MIIQRKNINVKKWDERVSLSNEDGAFFHFSWYLDAVAPNWEGFVLGDYEAIFPITGVNKWGVNFLIQPFLTRSFSPMGFEPSQMVSLQKYLQTHFRYVQLGSTHFSVDQAVGRTYQCLELNENAAAGFSENHRRQLKKFQAFSPKLTHDFRPDEVIQLFRKVKGEEFLHLKDRHYRMLRQLMVSANEQGKLFQFSVFVEGQMIGSSVYLKFGTKVLYLKGIVTSEYQKVGGMVYLHAEAIRFFSGDCVSFDFGGSNNQGLANFNRKFGAADREYLLLTSNRLPWPLKNLVNRKFG